MRRGHISAAMPVMDRRKNRSKKNPTAQAMGLTLLRNQSVRRETTPHRNGIL
jgi:hypothetical protein